jgi:Ice-binding-like/PEP-CTERM motif
MRNVFQRRTAPGALIVVSAALLCNSFPGWAGTLLGSAQSFTVLGYAGVTNTGPTQIYGNVGVSPLPLTSITGFPPGTVTGGSIFGPPSIADLALADINTAAITLDGLPVTSNLSNQDLGNRTLTPGVYFLSDVTALLNGTLTLDALGNPNAHFVFQLAHALTTGSGSVVNVINGNAGTEIYWVLGSSAALGSSSTFAGNILAGSSIALDSTAKIECGRAFARTESVTLIDNVISGNCSAQNFGSSRSDFGSLGFSGGTGGGGGGLQAIPEPGTFPLLSMGLGAGFLLLRKFRSIR